MSVAQLDVALDRPMPQSPDAERAVLGSILINNHAFYRVVGTLDTDDFFRDAHRTIFAAMKRMVDRSQEIDPLTFREELSKNAQLEQVGGSAYIASLTDSIPDIANCERYARIVKEKSNLRRLIVMGNSVMRAALDAPAESSDVMGVAEKELYSIAEGSIETGFVAMPSVVKANLLAIEAMQNSGKLLTGISTGYDRFNEFTSGFQNKDLIIIAARPAMGKTSFMMNITEAIAIPRLGDEAPIHSVGVFSLEMSREQLGLRLLSSVSGISNHLIRAGMLGARNWSDLTAAAARISKARIFVDDASGSDVMSVRAKARRLRKEAGVDLLMIDYLQLMSVKGKTESRNQEVSQISRGLKAVAKELDVPLIALSQLSRRPDQRGGNDHRPQLSDLRESGSIEQDADVVCFIYRDEVYNKDTEEKGIAEIIIAKHRNGPIGDFKLVFRNDITKFFNYEPFPDFTPSESSRMTREEQRDILQ